jgi:hypothetical protein
MAATTLAVVPTAMVMVSLSIWPHWASTLWVSPSSQEHVIE